MAAYTPPPPHTLPCELYEQVARWMPVTPHLAVLNALHGSPLPAIMTNRLCVARHIDIALRRGESPAIWAAWTDLPRPYQAAALARPEFWHRILAATNNTCNILINKSNSNSSRTNNDFDNVVLAALNDALVHGCTIDGAGAVLWAARVGNTQTLHTLLTLVHSPGSELSPSSTCSLLASSSSAPQALLLAASPLAGVQNNIKTLIPTSKRPRHRTSADSISDDASQHKSLHAAVVLRHTPHASCSAPFDAALRAAAEHGHATAVDVLLRDARCDRTGAGSSALRAAAENGHVAVVHALLGVPGVDPAAKNNYAVQWACWKGHVGVVAALLAHPGIDPTVSNNWPFCVAASNGHAGVVALMLRDPRVDPAAGNNSAIKWACEQGRSAVVTLLLADPRVDPACEQNYCVRSACRNGHLDVVKLLLADARVDAAALDDFAIAWAASNGHKEIVEMLLERRNISASSSAASTIAGGRALRWATEKGHKNIVQVLTTAR
ncbi:hypothetical protein HDU82_000445 [Entophlyctis luteolus]|nr:hypothetical protein HDU82_000445 [Entophlyctis luteolus]